MSATESIRRYVDEYRRELYRASELSETECEAAAADLRRRFKRLLEKRRGRVARRANRPAQAARAELFRKYGPDRAAEILYLAAEAGATDLEED